MDHKDIPATARVSAAPIFDHKAVAMGEIISLIRGRKPQRTGL